MSILECGYAHNKSKTKQKQNTNIQKQTYEYLLGTVTFGFCAFLALFYWEMIMIISTTWIWWKTGVCRIQTHVYSMFSSLLLIIESDNKRPEVQLTTELAYKLVYHRKCWSNFQWQVARNVCFRLALNLLITSSKLFISLHAVCTARNDVYSQ